jgi:hypothetical protein
MGTRSMTKPLSLTLRPAEIPRLLRPSGLVVLPVKQRLPSSDEVRQRTGTDYHWMQCNDFGKPDEFRVVGPVGVVRDLGGPTLLKCPLGSPGTEWVGRERYASPSSHIVAYESGGECGAWLGDGAGGRLWCHHGYIVEAPGYPFGLETLRSWGLKKYGGKWQSARSMPLELARIRHTTTRAELRRVRTISDDEIKATGIEPDRATDHPRGVWYTAFMDEFNARYPGAFERDDWAWFVRFEATKTN